MKILLALVIAAAVLFVILLVGGGRVDRSDYRGVPTPSGSVGFGVERVARVVPVPDVAVVVRLA